MRRWVTIGTGIAAAFAVAWYAGQSKEANSVPVIESKTPMVAAVVGQVPADLPPLKVVEVIDLSRAYEPASEGEASSGLVTASAVIPQPDVPTRMPYSPAPAADELTAILMGGFALKAMPEVLTVQPRVVPGLK